VGENSGDRARRIIMKTTILTAVLDRTQASIQTSQDKKGFFAVSLKLEVSEDEQKALFDLLKIGRQQIQIKITPSQLRLGDKYKI